MTTDLVLTRSAAFYPPTLGARPVATDDHDKPADAADAAGAAAAARDDLAAGSMVPSENETNGRPLNGTANGAAHGPAYGPEGGADGGAEGGLEAGAGAEAGDADDYEPYLPPGPNPFSSVHPQGTPAPYRPLGGNGSLGSAGPRGDNGPLGSAGPQGENGSVGSAGPLGGNGAYPPPFDRDPWSADRAPAPPEPAGEREPGSGHELEAEHESAESAEPPAPPHPGVSPYPPLPSDEFDGGRGDQPGYGSASPYPAYTPYGPDDEIADDALTDYGLPSPQSYGYAPPPPLAEPLPDVGVPEPRFGPSAPSAPPGSSAPQAPAAPPASPAFPDSPAPQSPPGPAVLAGPPSAPQAPEYRENGPDDGDFQDRAYRDRGDDSGMTSGSTRSGWASPAPRTPATGTSQRRPGAPASTRSPRVTRACAVRRRPPACPSPVCLSPGRRRQELRGLEWHLRVTRPRLRPSGGPSLRRSAPSPATRPPGHLKEGPSAARSPA